MKTTERTDNTHEQPIYELKHSIWFKIGVCFIAFIMLAMGAFGAVGVIISLSMPLFLVSFGDIYFYEGYVERRFLLPVKPYVIDYDKMHVHIYVDHFKLNSDRTLPKWYDAWSKHPYDYIRVASSSRYCTPEILEFIKTKAQSVNYHK